MAAETKTHSFRFGADPVTIITVLIGLVLAFFAYQLLAWLRDNPGKALVDFFKQTAAKDKVVIEHASQGLDAAASTYGYDTSAGQNDPGLRYTTARQNFARAAGYAPGDPEWLNPPGFPDQETWLADNPGPGDNAFSQAWDSFVAKL